MHKCRECNDHEAVALLAEGVDRNGFRIRNYITNMVSPSSRRAWIEMKSQDVTDTAFLGRPPRGGRG